MEDPELTSVTEAATATNGAIDEETEGALLDNLKHLRTEAADVFGTTKIMEVPGYHGLLAIEYQYINSEVTEQIARDIRRETKNVNGIGTNLLASLDTLIAASKSVMVRDKLEEEWRPITQSRKEWLAGEQHHKRISFRQMDLSHLLDYSAGDFREVALGIYGSEHAVIEANVILSRWLTDKSRTADEDFLG